MYTSPPLPRLLLCLALAAGAAAPAHAADGERAPCSLSPSDEMASDSADGKSLAIDARKPVAFVNWSVRWHQRQRLWVTLAATNRGETPVVVRAEFATDLQPDGGRSSGLAAPPQLIAPHASVTQRLALYVPDEAKTAAVLLQNLGPAADVAATLAVECSDKRFDPGQMKATAAALLDEALKVYSSVLADPIPNPQLALETVRVQASGAQDATDVAWAMRYLMASLHDAHSYIRPPGEAGPPPALAAATARPPAVELRDDVAVLRLAGGGAANEADRLADATRLHDLVAATAARHPHGWIVDLRQDGGGDMWAALAGLGTLLQGPVVGAFVGHETHAEWIVDRGAARTAGGKAIVDLQLPPEPPFGGPVAVLVGPHTAGAGEALATAFEGRPRTRFFGAPTQGRDDSAVVVHTLSDGTVLGVVGARNADRNGVVYRGPIEPDKLLAPDDGQALPHEALEWVQEQR